MTLQSAFRASNPHAAQFRAGMDILYRATNRAMIPAHVLRIAANGTHAMLKIEGRLGEQYEPLQRCEVAPEAEPRLIVIVLGNARLAARYAARRGITWERVRRSDCRVGPGATAGYVPLAEIGAVVRWYLEENAGNVTGACLYYARTTP